MITWIKDAAKIWWNQWTWPLKLVSGIAVAIVVLLLIGFGVKGTKALFCFAKGGCASPVITIDQASLDKVNAADKATRDAELKKKIEDNQEVVSTADNRTKLTEVEAEKRQSEIDKKVAEADKKVEEAKQQGHDVTAEELHCILTGEGCTGWKIQEGAKDNTP